MSTETVTLPSPRARKEGSWRGLQRTGGLLLLCALMICMRPAPVSAQTWDGSTSNDWTVDTNWSSNAAPTNGTVNIATTTPNSTVLGVSGAAVGTSNILFVGRFGGDSGNFTIQNGSDLTTSAYVRIGEGAGSAGIATITGAGSTWTVGGFVPSLVVGNFGTGTLNITDGGAMTLVGAVYIGRGNVGVINITGGGTLTSAGGVPSLMGADPAGNATVNVSGAGSAWTLGGTSNLAVGSRGVGTLNIQNGAEVISPNGVTLSDIAGSSGTLNVNGEATLETLFLWGGGGIVSQANFDGGILLAMASNANFINGFSGTELNIDAGGADR